MHMCGIACQQDAPLAIGRGLTSHVRESREPDGIVHSEISTVDGYECFTEIAQARLAAGFYFTLDQHNPRVHTIGRLVLADGMGASGVLTEAPRRLFGRMD